MMKSAIKRELVGTGGLGWHLNRRQGRLDSEQGRRKKVRHHI